MNAAARIAPKSPAANSAPALPVFKARCRARATLVRSADLDLIETVDELQAAAVATAVVLRIGLDAVQWEMAAAFADVPRPGELEDAFAEMADKIEVIAADLSRRRVARAVELARPMVADKARPTKERTRLLWAAAKAARVLGPPDVVHDAFMALAVEAGLINANGRWTGADVRPSVRRYGAEDIAHAIRWALRGWNPFEEGPLT